MTSIHTNLKKIRTEKKLTQEEVADKIGLTRQAISGYESGKRQPGIDILMALAEIYEVSIETILFGKKDIIEKDRTKHIAIIIAVIFFVFQILTGILSVTAFVLYPVEEGIVPPEQIPVLEKHFELSGASEITERISSFVLLAGSIIVMGFDLSKKSYFPRKTKIAFCLIMLGISLSVAILFSIIHPIYGIFDFMTRGPIYFVNVFVLLLIDLIISTLRQQKIRPDIPSNENF